MFNYTKETIINNISNVIVGTGSNGLTTNEFCVKRGANYKFDKILNKTVFRTECVEGKSAIKTITVGTLDADIYRITIFVSTPSQSFVEYAYPSWYEFGKPVLVEFTATGTASDDAEALAKALELTLQPDNHLFNVAVNGTAVVITFAEPWMHVDEINFEKMADDEKGIFEKITTGFTVDDTQDNVEDFATAKWLIENLRFPSTPNLRYTPVYADEKPISGEKYTQFAFMYQVKHSVPGGLSSVGQYVDSVTTHVFYVRENDADTFAGYFTSAGLAVDTTNNTVAWE